MSNIKDEAKKFKAFNTAAAAYILGEKSNVVLKGNSKRINATRNILEASRSLYKELNSPDATITTVASCLESKRKAAKQFHTITGLRWLL